MICFSVIGEKSGGAAARERVAVTMRLREQQAHLPDGRTLRCVVSGSGPLVVFEAGIGTGASMWAIVQELVAMQAHTVAYDRAGYGASSDDRLPRPFDRLAADRHLAAAAARGD